jgi:hypothetical protein
MLEKEVEGEIMMYNVAKEMTVVQRGNRIAV